MLRVQKIIAFSFLMMRGLTLLAQSKIEVASNDKSIGKDYISNKDILAKEFIFPEKIYHTYIDSSSNAITVQLRGEIENEGILTNNNGSIILFDLHEKQAKWSKRINYQQDKVEQYQQVIFKQYGGEKYRLNNKTGTQEWELINLMCFVEPTVEKGMGYKTNSVKGITNKLEGINLTNGDKTWQREINREFGWNEMIRLNDSNIIVAAAGLHAINIHNGTGWDYNAITGEKDYTYVALGAASVVVSGIVGGMFFVPSGPDITRDMVSNILIDSGHFYFASKEQIAKINPIGKVVWSASFPENFGSNSFIFKRDQTIYMLNKGLAYLQNKQVDYGSPFIAAFDAQTGKELFLRGMNDNIDHVLGTKIDKDYAMVLFHNKTAKYSLIDGSLVQEKILDFKKSETIDCFIDSQVCIKENSFFKFLTQSDTVNHYVKTKSGKILMFNSQLEIIQEIDPARQYKYYLDYNGCKFLAKDNMTIVIDRDNKVKADMAIGSKVQQLGTKLYFTEKNSLLELDLNEITK